MAVCRFIRAEPLDEIYIPSSSSSMNWRDFDSDYRNTIGKSFGYNEDTIELREPTKVSGGTVYKVFAKSYEAGELHFVGKLRVLDQDYMMSGGRQPKIKHDPLAEHLPKGSFLKLSAGQEFHLSRRPESLAGMKERAGL